jgi:hypothetical protein
MSDSATAAAPRQMAAAVMTKGELVKLNTALERVESLEDDQLNDFDPARILPAA